EVALLVFREVEHRVNITHHGYGIRHFKIYLATKHDVLSIPKRPLQSQPGASAHHHRITDRRLFEKFQVGRVVPGQPATFADRQIPIYCDDADNGHYDLTSAVDEHFINTHPNVFGNLTEQHRRDVSSAMKRN